MTLSMSTSSSAAATLTQEIKHLWPSSFIRWHLHQGLNGRILEGWVRSNGRYSYIAHREYAYNAKHLALSPTWLSQNSYLQKSLQKAIAKWIIHRRRLGYRLENLAHTIVTVKPELWSDDDKVVLLSCSFHPSFHHLFIYFFFFFFLTIGYF